MTKEELIAFLKENLQVNVSIDTFRYPSPKMKVSVQISLEDELICESESSTSLYDLQTGKKPYYDD